MRLFVRSCLAFDDDDQRELVRVMQWKLLCSITYLGTQVLVLRSGLRGIRFSPPMDD